MEQEHKTKAGGVGEANPQHDESVGRFVLIRVGGVVFCLDPTTIERLNSEPLVNLLNSGRPSDGIYEAKERDAECFSAFLHMARFGSIPMNLISKEDKKKRLMKEANYWGVRKLVDEVASRDRDLFRTSYSSKLDALRGKPPKGGTTSKENTKNHHGYEEEGSI